MTYSSHGYLDSYFNLITVPVNCCWAGGATVDSSEYFASVAHKLVTLSDFSAKLRNETDFEAMNGELLAVVHVTLWLRKPGSGDEGS
jgi:hypothetical protein